ncbi:MAG TPA: carbonic anhydrase [Candidatus Limnocylindrales bacterium]|nr:carbonic anhydrase [Candidatus Limnocylindrales bacterium]
MTNDQPDELERVLLANERFAADAFTAGGLGALGPRPARRLAVVACMDARLDVARALGLGPGDAHVIRNAGGLATDDAIRSLAISRAALGADTVLVVEHTGCGLLGLDDDALRQELDASVALPLGGFDDLETNLRAQIERIASHPWTAGMTVHGLIYDVASGRLSSIGTTATLQPGG